MFLRDAEIKNLVSDGYVEHVDFGSGDPDGPDSPVQPCSLDLKIGAIYLPGAAPGEAGSSGAPLNRHAMGVGETVVVETREVFHLPSHVGAFGFPPTSVSNVGVLVTNLGHIDPGYHGTIKFTLVNMGRKAYPLRRGDSIYTTLFFTLSSAVIRDYGARNPGYTAAAPAKGVSAEALSALPKDFLDIENRATKLARRAVTGTFGFWTSIVASLGALVAVAVKMYIDTKEVDEVKALLQEHRELVEARLSIADTAREARDASEESTRAIRELESEVKELQRRSQPRR